MTVVAPAADALQVIRDLLGEAETAADCQVLAVDVRGALAAVDAGMRVRAGEPRPAVVRCLGAAVVHLGRAGSPAITVGRACELAGHELSKALLLLGAGS